MTAHSHLSRSGATRNWLVLFSILFYFFLLLVFHLYIFFSPFIFSCNCNVKLKLLSPCLPYPTSPPFLSKVSATSLHQWPIFSRFAKSYDLRVRHRMDVYRSNLSSGRWCAAELLVDGPVSRNVSWRR